jgi:hypothetical protein
MLYLKVSSGRAWETYPVWNIMPVLLRNDVNLEGGLIAEFLKVPDIDLDDERKNTSNSKANGCVRRRSRDC